MKDTIPLPPGVCVFLNLAMFAVGIAYVISLIAYIAWWLTVRFSQDFP